MTEHIHLQCNITARQQGTNKWTLTVDDDDDDDDERMNFNVA